MPPTQKHRALAIGSPLGEDVLLLRHFAGTEILGRPFEYQLQLASSQPNIAFKDIVGQAVTIRVELSAGGTRYFNGIVNRFGHSGQSGRVFHYHATVVPWLWLLTRMSDCRIFQEMTVPEIVEKVFRDRGFTDFRHSLAGTYRRWDYCVQYRETDFNFVSRLMEQEGIYYYFEHEDGKHTLIMADSTNAHQPVAGYATVPFRPFDQGVQKGELINEWRAEERLQPGAYELNDFDFTVPRKNLRAKARNPGEHAWGDLPIYDYPGEYSQPGHGNNYAQVRLQELQADQYVYWGRANARGLGVGHTFKLADFPVAALNQEYLITQTNLSVQGDDFEGSGGGSGGEFCQVNFSAIEIHKPFRAARTTPKPIVQGPQTALVVGKAGEEIWTDSFGRVKVKFHWDRYAKGDENSSCWIRVSQNWASKKWGTFFLPRIGQEVIVEFLEGDPDRPIVTGCVYNGDAPTPYDLPKEATKSTIKTNTSKGGNGFNEIRFEDKKGKEQIFIHGQRDLDVRVRDDIRETNYGNRDIRVGWEKDGAKGGDLNTFVRKDVNTHVEGGQFEQVDKQLNQTVKEDVVEDYQKNQTTVVKDKLQLNAKEIVIEGGQLISQKSGKITIQGAQGVHIKGMSVAIEGSTGVSLKVGGNFVSLSPAGVAIKGSLVMINSGGAGLAAEAAKALVAPEIQAPFEARRADDGKTGGPTKVSASPIQMLKRLLSPQKAPDYVPPPSSPAEKAVTKPPTPPVAQSNKPCGIADLEVNCSHKRKPGPERVLQIVGTPDATQTVEKEIAGVTVKVELKSAGKDEVTGKVKPRDASAGGRKQLALLEGGAAPSESEWQNADSKTFTVRGAAGPTNGEWLANASPKKFHLYGRGCDDAMQSVVIENYPSEQGKISVSLEVFKAWGESVNKGLKKWGEKAMGISPVELKPSIEGPAGSVELGWGWKEDSKSWKAFFEIAVDFSLNPIFGFKLEITVSFMKIAGTAGGLPPWVSDLLAEHLADVLVKTSGGAKAKLTGGPRAEFYATGEEHVKGEATLAVSGEFKFSVSARAGSDYVASVQVSAEVATSVTGQAKAELVRSGLYLQPKVVLGDCKVELTIKTTAFKIYTKERVAGSWTVWEERDLYEGDKRKLLPLSNRGTS